MKHSFLLNYSHITLKPLEHGDIERLRLLRNRIRYCFIDSTEITQKDQQQWYTRYLNKQGDYMFSIYKDDCWIGTVALYNLKGNKQSVEFGRLLIDKERAGCSGLGVEATKGACLLAFNQLGVDEVFLEVYTDNISAQITYLKAGFEPISITLDEQGKNVINMVIRKR